MRISTNLFRERGVNTILDLQQSLSHTQLQVSTGKRVITPSDDPVASTQILNFRQEIELTERYQSNGDAADGRVKLEEATLSSVTSLLQRVRDLILQGGSGALTTTERNALATEVEQRVGEVLGLANTQFAGTEYIFAGSKTDTEPFQRQGVSTFVYNGDQTDRQVQISASIQITVADSGYRVFQDIKNGNGSFTTGEGGNTVTPGPNLGTGVINSGTVTDRVNYVDDDYTIAFVTNGNGKLGYTVTGATTGQIIPAPPGTIPANAPDYVEGAEINFNGHSVKITGTPAVGDSFAVAPSQQQDMFATLTKAVAALRSPDFSGADKARLDMALGSALTDLDQALNNVDTVRGEVGTRLNAIETEDFANEDFKIAAKTTLASIEDLDLVEAISRLQQQKAGLDAAQQSYVQVQNLSLFNYLR